MSSTGEQQLDAIVHSAITAYRRGYNDGVRARRPPSTTVTQPAAVIAAETDAAAQARLIEQLEAAAAQDPPVAVASSPPQLAPSRPGSSPLSWAKMTEAGPPPHSDLFDALVTRPPEAPSNPMPVTEFLAQHSAKPAGAKFDNSAVHSYTDCVALGISVAIDPPVPKSCDLTQRHDMGALGAGALCGLGLVPMCYAVPVTLQLKRADAEPLWLRARIDLVAMDWRDHSLVVVNFKTSAHVAQPSDWRKDLARRTYIQQVHLEALAVAQRYGTAPRRCLIIGLPSSGDPVVRRLWIDYNAERWLTGVNEHLARFRRWKGEPADPSPLPQTVSL